jgi:hypothetical protein
MKMKGNPEVPAAQVNAFRLARHRLLEPDATSLANICRDVGGIQAQMMSAAEIGLWARRRPLRRAEIHAALWTKRALVKTLTLRRTLHLLPAADFPVYASALRSNLVAQVRRIMARLGVTPAEADALNDAIADALRSGPLPTKAIREKVVPKVSKRVRKFLSLVWSICWPAMVEGLVCYGPPHGAEVTFVLVKHWLPGTRPLEELKARQILLRRFLGAYGPATPRDLAKWTGIPMPGVNRTWESLADELVEVSVGGQRASLLRKDLPALAKASLSAPVVRLLPNFDSYLLGHADKSHLVHARHYKRVYRNAGWISPVVLIDGRVAGVWALTRKGKGITISVTPFDKLTKAHRAAIEEEAASLGVFLEAPCTVTWRS